MASMNSRMVLNYMKDHFGQEISKNQIAEELGIKVSAIGLSMRSHVLNGRATERVEENITYDDKGKETVKKTYFYTLTEAGLAFDIDAHEAQKKEEQRAKAVEKRAAKKAAAAAAADEE